MKDDMSIDDILAAIADGETIDWEYWKTTGGLSNQQIRALQAMDRNRLNTDKLPFIQSGSGFSTENESADSPTKDQRIEQALTCWKTGRITDPVALSKQFPDLKEEISDFFHLLDRFTRLRDDIDETSADRPLIIDDFEIIRKIGTGGMAAVYEAWQLSLKRGVAIKILPPHLSFSNEAVQKFQREAEACSRLNDPGIVSVYAIGKQEGLHYIVMELIEGGYSLADRMAVLSREGRPPMGYFREAASFVAEVAKALEQAHSSQVIHRDIKPSNILITTKGQPKVTDFGLAKVEDALALSRTGDLAGTPYYMSPEQASTRKGVIDHRTDVYSLGVTLFEMITFRRPFEGDSTHDILKQVLNHEPQNPTRLNPRVPRDLAVICLKAIEKDPIHRYQSMREFADDLHRYLQGEVIQARPAGIGIKVWKRVKRNPMVTGAMTVTMIAVLTAAVVIPWLMMQKEIEKKSTILATDKYEITNKLFKSLFWMIADTKSIERESVLELIRGYEKDVTVRYFKEPLEIASSKKTLANIAAARGFYEESARLNLEALEIRTSILGEDDGKTLITKAGYARILGFIGEPAESRRLFNEVYDQCQSCFHDNDFFLLGLHRKMAKELFISRKIAEVRQLCERVIQALKSDRHTDYTYGGIPLEDCVLTIEWLPRFLMDELYNREKFNENPTFNTLKDLLVSDFEEYLARVCIYNEDYENAELYLADIQPLRLRTFKNPSVRIIRVFKKRVLCLVELKRYEEVNKLQSQYLETCLSCGSKQTEPTVTTLQHFAYNLHEQGRYEEAIDMLEKALAIFVQSDLEVDHTFWRLSRDIGANYQGMGDLHRAEYIFRTAYHAIVDMKGNKHIKSLKFLHFWIENLIEFKRYRKAFVLLLDGFTSLTLCRITDNKVWKGYFCSLGRTAILLCSFEVSFYHLLIGSFLEHVTSKTA